MKAWFFGALVATAAFALGTVASARYDVPNPSKPEASERHSISVAHGSLTITADANESTAHLEIPTWLAEELARRGQNSGSGSTVSSIWASPTQTVVSG